jgi:hypothetical protein
VQRGVSIDDVENFQGLEDDGDEDEEEHGSVELAPAVFQVGKFSLVVGRLEGGRRVPQALVVDLGHHLGREGNDANLK